MDKLQKPILFTAPNVRAILDDRKTQTRRIIKPQFSDTPGANCTYLPKYFPAHTGVSPCTCGFPKCPYGAVGDLLYCRESYRICNMDIDRKQALMVHYYSDRSYHSVVITDTEMKLWKARKKPFNETSGRFMYKSLARIWLEITGIRVERVQDISGLDVLAEGINLPIPPNVDASPPPIGYDKWSKERQDDWAEGMARTMVFARAADAENCFNEFQKLWDSINAERGYSWESNPWVWVVEFKRISGEVLK